MLTFQRDEINFIVDAASHPWRMERPKRRRYAYGLNKKGGNNYLTSLKIYAKLLLKTTILFKNS